MQTLANSTLLPYYVETDASAPHSHLPESVVPAAVCQQPVVPASPEPRPLPGDKQTQYLTGLLSSMSGLYPLSEVGDMEMALLVQQLLVGEARL
jgi:hypothetical protein